MADLHGFIAESNDIEMLRELLTGAENPNSQDRFGQTPLHIAVLKSGRNPEETDEILLVVRELIYFGANVNQGNNLNKTPLHLAVGCRNYKMTKMLLLSNAQINQQDNEGCTALHFATSKCRFCGHTYNLDLSIVELLLKYNPELDMQKRNGETALMLAVQNKNFPIVRTLLREKASGILQDTNGDSAMHYALHCPEVDVNIVFELMRHGCSFKMSNNCEMTPLNLYFFGLINAPITEQEKAKFVFKLYLLDGKDFNDLQQWLIREICKKMKFPLSRYVLLCAEEIKQMRLDKLAPDCSVYDIALRGGYYSVAERTHVPIEVFDKVLKKLLRLQYPFYRDLIVAGICRPYINKEFAEWCSITEMDNKLVDFDVLFSVSSYLSNFDMLNMMLACAGGWRRHWYLPRFTYSTRCIIS